MKVKTFDAVRLMRELRDKLSQEMENMTPGERVHYIQDKAAMTPLGRAMLQGTHKTTQQIAEHGRAKSARRLD